MLSSTPGGKEDWSEGKGQSMGGIGFERPTTVAELAPSSQKKANCFSTYLSLFSTIFFSFISKEQRTKRQLL